MDIVIKILNYHSTTGVPKSQAEPCSPIMAMPYPEGEVFFKRSALQLKGRFNPEDLKEFTSNILIEYVCNQTVYSRHYRAHPCFATAGNGKYYYSSSFNVMFSKEDDIGKTTRVVKIAPMNDGKELRDRANGGPNKVVIMPVPVKGGERYLYMDLLVPVRAVYLPLAQNASDMNEDLCTYIMVDFRFRKGVEMMFPDGAGREDDSYLRYQMPTFGDKFPNEAIMNWNGKEFNADDGEVNPDGGEANTDDEKVITYTYPLHARQEFSYQDGLGIQSNRTLGLDMLGIYNLLVLPRQLRSPDKGLYKPTNPDDTLIKNYDYHALSNYVRYEVEDRSFQPILDYSKVISDHFGVDVTWQPYEYKEEAASLISQVFNIIVSTGLNFVPVVGPLVSVGFSAFMEAVNDPEAFKASNILKLDDDSMGAVLESAGNMALNLPKLRGKGGGIQVIKMATSIRV